MLLSSTVNINGCHFCAQRQPLMAYDNEDEGDEDEGTYEDEEFSGDEEGPPDEESLDQVRL